MTEAARPRTDERAILTVTELTQLIKKRFRVTIGMVHVAGEVSKPFLAQSGHLYFDLKDEESLVRCAIWRGTLARIPFEIEHGIEIVAFGTLDAYGPRSQYTLIVSGVEPRGRGALQMRFEQLKAKLQKEGLFDEARERPIPFLPQAVGVVTSIDSAARHDIEDTLLNRFPPLHIVYHNVRVQGEGAAEEIAAAIHRLNLSRPEVEVLIVGRGGGSLEDLWAFNEEVVARAIAASRIPVISAVGHETDFTIADFVADLRAKTPTEAAHRAVPDLTELHETLDRHAGRMTRSLQATLLDATRRVDEGHTALGTALRHTTADARHRLTRLDGLLPRAVHGALAARRASLESAARKLDPRAMRATFGHHRAMLRSLDGAMSTAVRARLREAKERVARLGAALEALSPLSVLGRGYSITRDAETGRLSTDAAGLKKDQRLETILRKGRVISRVEAARPEST